MTKIVMNNLSDHKNLLSLVEKGLKICEAPLIRYGVKGLEKSMPFLLRK